MVRLGPRILGANSLCSLVDASLRLTGVRAKARLDLIANCTVDAAFSNRRLTACAGRSAREGRQSLNSPRVDCQGQFAGRRKLQRCGQYAGQQTAACCRGFVRRETEQTYFSFSPILKKIFAPCFQAVRRLQCHAPRPAPATLKSSRGLRPPRRPQQLFLAGQQALQLRWY